MRPLTPGTGADGCDVLVAGGGVAGVAAAVSAARGGCRVVLIESTGRLGGIGVRGMLRTICGLFGTSLPPELLNKGIVGEIVSALRQAAPERTARKAGKVYVLPCAADDLEHALLALCRSEPRLSVEFESRAVSANTDAGRITGLVVESGNARRVIRAHAVIDCSGSGDVAVMAGAEFDRAAPGEIQMAGYVVRITGLRDRDGALAFKVPYTLAEAVRKGELAACMRFTTYASGDIPGEAYLKFSVDEAAFSGDEKPEQDILKAVRLLARHIPAFAGAAAVRTSGRLEREGRRIRGEYTLTAEDVLAARKFPDAVAKNAWPIELWDRAKGPSYRYVPEGDHYEIPFRCLKARGFQNLLTAGRCISATREALGSVRVMGACLAVGEAAGRAAAHLVKTGFYPKSDSR